MRYGIAKGDKLQSFEKQIGSTTLFGIRASFKHEKYWLNLWEVAKKFSVSYKMLDWLSFHERLKKEIACLSTEQFTRDL